jgi:hypothetical protein
MAKKISGEFFTKGKCLGEKGLKVVGALSKPLGCKNKG